MSEHWQPWLCENSSMYVNNEADVLAGDEEATNNIEAGRYIFNLLISTVLNNCGLKGVHFDTGFINIFNVGSDSQ
jgi:hypothetical protein